MLPSKLRDSTNIITNRVSGATIQYAFLHWCSVKKTSVVGLVLQTTINRNKSTGRVFSPCYCHCRILSVDVLEEVKWIDVKEYFGHNSILSTSSEVLYWLFFSFHVFLLLTFSSKDISWYVYVYIFRMTLEDLDSHSPQPVYLYKIYLHTVNNSQ